MNMHVQWMIKRLMWTVCMCSAFGAFMLFFEFGIPVRNMTESIPQRKSVNIIVTRKQNAMVTGLHSYMVSSNKIITLTSDRSNMSTTKQSSVVISNQSSSRYTSYENPSNYLHSERFDLIVKMVYAYFYVYKKQVPKVVQVAYAEHLRVWNNFTESFDKAIMITSWFDGKRPCIAKRNEYDFISSFHKTIKNIRKKGFNSSVSRIPLDKRGFLLNGAHRVAAAVILSKSASFEHHGYKHKKYSKSWGYRYFKDRGMPEMGMNLVMLEWMKIQFRLPYLNTFVSVVSIFSNNYGKDVTMRKIVKERCSKDNDILYEIQINVTKSGMRQLITHLYGQQPWLDTKIQHMLSKFHSTYTAVFLFFYAKTSKDLVQCKTEIRKLYNDKVFKSTAHIPDTAAENIILAEMILNQNSILFMNYAKNGSDCKLIAKEVASRSSIAMVKTLPGIYVGRDDVMIDSGTVLGLFGMRKRTDVDLLFLGAIDKSLLVNRNGMAIQAHAFKNNSISKERAWGEDHFNDNGTRDQWDLFYDPNNFGYCYGIKFVSLEQLVRYKTKRNEPQKDSRDVKLIQRFLKVIT